jgi:iron complex transport system substrate-binding protein
VDELHCHTMPELQVTRSDDNAHSTGSESALDHVLARDRLTLHGGRLCRRHLCSRWIYTADTAKYHHQVPTVSLRIASLLPSATEIVCAVGAADGLVGRSHECDFPPSVASRPVLTRARLHPVRSSRDVDAEVRSVLQNALAVYEVEIDRLREAHPDVIVTQDLCDVCAVSLDDVRAAVARLGMQGVRIVNLHPSRLADIWDDMTRVASALGRADEGALAVERLRARVQEVHARARPAPARPRVLAVEWLDPIMIGGMWMPELIGLAGGTAMVTAPGDHAPTLSLEALQSLDPDIVLIKPCGFSLERTLEEVTLLKTNLPWDRWSCVREGRVFVSDGNAYFNRPGPRIVESLEILAACVHPSIFADLRRKHRSAIARLGPSLARQPFDP